MAVVRALPELRVGQQVEQASPVSGRHDPVQTAVHEQHRDPDVGQGEAPRARVRDVVVDRAVGPRLACGAGVLAERAPRTRSAAQSASTNPATPSSSASAARSSRPLAAARSAASDAMPAAQSNPSKGASPARLTTAVARSPSSAPHASACGPPPDAPTNAARVIPNASSTAATSPAAEATSRPGRADEPPYDGRP